MWLFLQNSEHQSQFFDWQPIKGRLNCNDSIIDLPMSLWCMTNILYHSPWSATIVLHCPWVLREFFKVFQKDLLCTLIILFIEWYLHVHANLRLPNFDAQNSTQIGRIICKHASLLNHILTLNIPLTQTSIFEISEVYHFNFLYFNLIIYLNN